MEILIYLIIGALAIAPGIVATVLRKRFNWPLSMHWITPLGLPFLVVIALTLNLIFTSHDDSQFAFGLAALSICFFPFAALYGVTAWAAEKVLVSKKHSNGIRANKAAGPDL